MADQGTRDGVAACDAFERVLNQWRALPADEAERDCQQAARNRARLAELRGITESELIRELDDEREGLRSRRPETTSERSLSDAIAGEMRAMEVEKRARRSDLMANATTLALAVISYVRALPGGGAFLSVAAIRLIAAGETEPREWLYDAEPRPPKNIRDALDELKLVRAELLAADGGPRAPSSIQWNRERRGATFVRRNLDELRAILERLGVPLTMMRDAVRDWTAKKKLAVIEFEAAHCAKRGVVDVRHCACAAIGSSMYEGGSLYLRDACVALVVEAAVRELLLELSNRAVDGYGEWAKIVEEVRPAFAELVFAVADIFESAGARVGRDSLSAVIASSTFHEFGEASMSSRPHVGVAGLGSFAQERLEAHLRAHEVLRDLESHLPTRRAPTFLDGRDGGRGQLPAAEATRRAVARGLPQEAASSPVGYPLWVIVGKTPKHLRQTYRVVSSSASTEKAAVAIDALGATVEQKPFGAHRMTFELLREDERRGLCDGQRWFVLLDTCDWESMQSGEGGAPSPDWKGWPRAEVFAREELDGGTTIELRCGDAHELELKQYFNELAAALLGDGATEIGNVLVEEKASSNEMKTARLPALSNDDKIVLGCLVQAMPFLLKQRDIEENNEEGLSRTSIGKSLKRLERDLLVHRPNGRKKGYGATPLGDQTYAKLSP